MSRTLALALALALSLVSSGCIANMADLKDRVGDDDAVQPAAVVEAPTPTTAAPTNATQALKAPVARITLFGPNGALVFKSTFQADDPADMIFVDAKSTLNGIGSDSEALEAGATLTGFAWTLNGKAVEGARQAAIAIDDAGVYTVGLTVTDSNGKSDTQTVKLAVAPEPYDVVLELMTGPIAGANGEGAPETLAFTLAADESKGPATVQKVVIVASPDVTLDAAIAVLDKDGAPVGDADDAGHTDVDQTETIELAAIPLGDYSIAVTPFAGADADGVPITITITFLPVIEGLSGGDGHGHAH